MRHSTGARLGKMALALLGVGALPAWAAAQTDVEELGRQYGATPPPGYYQMLRSIPNAFQFSSRNGWVMRGRAVAAARNRARSRIVAVRRAGPGEPFALRAAETQAAEAVMAGHVDVPVFLIMYSDTDSAGLVQNVPRDVLRVRLFGTDPAPPYSINSYYRELSNDSLLMTGTVFPWTRVSQTGSHYAGSGNGLDQTGDMPGLIDDIVSAHDDTVDFGQFDNDGPDGIPNSPDDDGYVDAIVMMHPDVDGSCQNVNPAAANNVWAHRFCRSQWETGNGCRSAPYVTDDLSVATGDSIRIDDYIIQGGQGGDDGCAGNEPQAMGLVAHEVGHLFGLPDLYDNTSGGSGIGRWGLMGSGNWRVPVSPAHMTAWSKAELGWVTEVVVDRDTTLDISPIITSDTSYTIPIDGTNEYFILENRQRLGSDTALYSEGLLVFLADTFLLEQRGNWVNSFRPYALALVQADGRDDLMAGTNRGDEGDPFPGFEDNRTLGVCTDPASDTNYDGPSLVVLDSITQLGPLGAIRTSIKFFQPDPVLAGDQAFDDGLMGETFNHRFLATGGIDCDRRWSVVGGTLPNGLLLMEDGLLFGRLEESGSFTAQLQVASGQQTDTATVTLTVGIPALTVDEVAAHLLGAPTQLDFFEVTYLDLQGNRNGEFDLGDFLGWVESGGAAVTAEEVAQLLQAASAGAGKRGKP